MARGADALAANAEAMIAELERSWSRFVPTSELSRLNCSAGGPPVAVSRPTFDLVGAAVEAWRLTAGRFDPTVLEALVASGYDATFDSIGTVRSAPSGAPSPGPVGIDCDPIALTVRLPLGVSIDLGGIGKGRAADLVAGWLMDRGVDGACVDLGGDVALVGRPEPDEAWVIGVAHPLTEDLVCSVRLSSGAVATSTTARRRWATTAGPAHHLIDPATGRPVETDVASVTVLAAEAMWAEVLAKAALIAGRELGSELVVAAGACATMVGVDGSVTPVGGIERFVA